MGKEKVSDKLVWASTSDARIKRRYNGQLYARFTKVGIRIEQRLHETSLGAAKKACDGIEILIAENRNLTPVEIAEKIKQMFGKEAERGDAPVLLGEYWPKFIAFRKEGSKIHKYTPWRPKTLKEYEAFWIRSFEPFWANKLPTEIGASWQGFIEAERKRSNKGSDLKFVNHKKYFDGFMSYLVKMDVLPKKQLIWNPDPDVDQDGEEIDGNGIVIPDPILKVMLEASSGVFGLYIALGITTGMRSSEMTQLKVNRLDLANLCVRLRPIDVKTGSKTKKGRVIPLQESVVAMIRHQLSQHPGAEFLFPNLRDEARPMSTTGFNRSWNELREILDLPITPHDMRHTFATKIFSQPNVNPSLSCKALGMGMLTAEKHYIHFDETHLRIVADNFRIED